MKIKNKRPKDGFVVLFEDGGFVFNELFQKIEDAKREVRNEVEEGEEVSYIIYKVTPIVKLTSGKIIEENF
jgi:hypothetical protein